MNPYAKSFVLTRKGDSINTQLNPTFAAAQYQHNSADVRHDLDIFEVMQAPEGGGPCVSQRLEEEESVQRLSQLTLSMVESPPQPLPPPGLPWPERELEFHHDWSLSSYSASDASSGGATRVSSKHSLNLNVDPYQWPSFPSWNMSPPADAMPVSRRAICPGTGLCSEGQVASSIASIQARPYDLKPDQGLGSDQFAASPYGQHPIALQPSRTFDPIIPYQRPHQSFVGISNVRTSLEPKLSTQPTARATSAMAAPSNTMQLAASSTRLATVPDRPGTYECSDFSRKMVHHNGLQHRHPDSVQRSSGLAQQSSVERGTHSIQQMHGFGPGCGGGAERPQGPSPFNRKEEKYKSELCRNWEEKGFCYYRSRCQFAHGEHELRKVERNPRWKSRLCKRYQLTGSCHFAKRCCFNHDPNCKPEHVASINRARRSSLLQRVGIVPSPNM